MTRPSREMSRQGNAFRGRVSQGSVLGEVSVGELFSGGGGGLSAYRLKKLGPLYVATSLSIFFSLQEN